MSPGERAPVGRREPVRPQYAAQTPGYPPSYYPPYGVPHPNAWLGAPLISMTGRPPPQRHTPISKLAMHAQGAPLIIQNRPDRRKYTTTPEQRHHRPLSLAETSVSHLKDRCERSMDASRSRNAQHQQVRSTRGGRGNNTDAVSVASDESSGSTNSETMLPRIIKPRKRRKKDRKPNNMAPHDMSVTSLEDIEQHCGVPGVTASSHNIYNESYCRDVVLPYRLDVKVLDYSDPVSDSYKVSALGEALEATRFGVAEAVSPAESAVSTCQCRYCDPVGQIWDADAIADLLDESSSGDFAPTKLEESMKVVGPLGRRGADTTLRRSWSDPFARAPERRDVSYSEASSAPNLYSLFPPTRRASSPHEPRSPLALEISSEIVTSINGHRDLEIKFFSTSPPAITSERRSFFDSKSESVSGCATNDRKQTVNSVVNCEKVGANVNIEDKQKSDDVSDSGCSSSFNNGGFSRNQCDLTLITA